ncbi:hypothetical protein AVEN_260079-1 [Araneus ventricosus]|uniref:GIY-YIG domain-containing protein n=1 Tax=Araneus ventricosus TaxID=182803 RepID=A0A4Y2G5B6_ARAVE|nr:hypothetical protein AVEN_260079-1 [Araneus ventricosus]
MPLSYISDNVPPQPGIYELKVVGNKMTNYVEGCSNLRQKLTLYRLKQNSGKKDVDQIIKKNYSNILVRFEQLSSVAEVKREERIRVTALVGSYLLPTMILSS